MSIIPKQDQNSVIAVFSQNSAAEKAIKELLRPGNGEKHPGRNTYEQNGILF